MFLLHSLSRGRFGSREKSWGEEGERRQGGVSSIYNVLCVQAGRFREPRRVKDFCFVLSRGDWMRESSFYNVLSRGEVGAVAPGGRFLFRTVQR